MHLLPKDFDLSRLVGTQITQICVDEYQIQVHFENAHIAGAGKVCLEVDGETVEIFHGKWKSCSGLERVIGAQVEEWRKNSDNEFLLNLDSGVFLRFRTEEGPYEDFTVRIGEKEYWVL